MKSPKNSALLMITLCIILAVLATYGLLRHERKQRARIAKMEHKLRHTAQEKAAAKKAAGNKAAAKQPAKSAPQASTDPKTTFKPIDLKIERTIAAPDRVTARRNLVVALHQAVSERDYRTVAMLNSLLSQEAFVRCCGVAKAWESLRDPETGLSPHSSMEGVWKGRDNAADFYPFLLMTTHYLLPESEPSWLKMMQTERNLNGPLPQVIHFQPTRVVDPGIEERVFSGAEFVKDGLISVVEREGRGAAFDRMEEVMQAIIAKARIRTKGGKLLSADDSEVNGDIAQVLPRLYWATGKKEYLDMCEAIAETYLFEIMPANNGLPAAFWNFQTGKSENGRFQLRDHGNEIIPGLSEIYILEKSLKRPQAERYREPLRKLLTTLLTVGRTKDGMWHNWVKTDTLQTTDTYMCDNWGYLCNAYLTFDIAEGTKSFTPEVLRAMRAATTYKSYHWEGMDMDGYADTVESMLYMLERNAFPAGDRWVDDEIEVMFLKQQESGFVEGTYLDGNFVRTALLYANYKTKGTSVSPWRPDVCMGAASAPDRKEVFLHLSAQAPWRGVVRFDYARHRAIWNMTVSYPRLNSWPEWFVVDPKKAYAVTDTDSGKKRIFSGAALIAGMPLTLDGVRPVRLKVTEERRAMLTASAN